MKLGFVGAGRIGSTTAFACLLRMDVDEIALVDIAEDLAVGEAMDLRHAAAGLDRYPNIEGGSDYSLLDGSDIIIVSAGLARKPGMTRLDLLKKNAGILKGIANELKRFSTNILVVSNPMDLMTYFMWKESGLPRNRVFGMGNMLDSSRLKEQLNKMGVKDIKKACILGEHGDSMFYAKCLADFKGEINPSEIEERTRQVAAEVIRRKGATFYGPAVSIYRMVRAVAEDTKEEIPTSVVLEGEYGITGVSVGVPAILGKNGVEKVIEYELTEGELTCLRKSAALLMDKAKSVD